MENKINQNLSLNKNNNKSFLFSTSLIFDQNIDKLWLYLRDLSSEAFNVDFLDDFKFIKGDNTWTIGNISSIYWVGVTHITIKCKSIKVDRTRKKIKWKFKCDIGIQYYKSITLYRVTESGQTLVKVCVSRTKKKNSLVDHSQGFKYYLELQYNLLMKQKKYLQSIKNDIISYESCIINENYIKLWKYLIDLNNMSELTSSFSTNLVSNGPINEVGTFIKFYDKNLKKVIFLKVIKYENSTNKKIWIFRLEKIGIENLNVPKIIEIKICIINNNKTQLSFMHKFSYDSNPNYISEFIINMKNILKKIKDREKVLLDEI